MIQPPGQTPRYPSLPLDSQKQRQLDHLEQEKDVLRSSLSQGSFASGLRNNTAKDGPMVAHGSWTG